MTGSSWSQLYDEAQSGVVAGVPESVYEAKVVDARVHAPSRLIFLDWGIQVGPQAGQVAQTNLFVPDPTGDSNKYRGQMFHFRKKIAGFGDLSTAFSAMPEGDTEAALTILAEALVGRSCLADIGVRTDGEYAGTNELRATKPLGDATPEPAADVAAAEAAPAPVAEAPAPAPEAPAAAPAAAAAATEDLPF
jgi:hypothetical protein